MTATVTWLADDRRASAETRILDAAARLFLERGVSQVGMIDIAEAAGCSRATLYRYFADRTSLYLAYIHRETRRIAADISTVARRHEDPRERLLTTVAAALCEVRGVPALLAWFRAVDVGTTTELANRSPVIVGITASLLGDATDPDVLERARWLVRVVVSLLATPGADPEDERRMLERFVVPLVV
ncbi:MAG TPA: helix-turn-helix domain-containing protein [Mycobacteriales bacterium]|nr:helix-turn-helix domain-containing protein [Mycobacteriales bacterium]